MPPMGLWPSRPDVAILSQNLYLNIIIIIIIFIIIIIIIIKA